MSYRDPYADPYYGSNRHQVNADPGYSQNEYAENYNPYPSNQGAYGTEMHLERPYTDDPVYPPQRQPTQRQHSSSGTLYHRKEPGADFAPSSTEPKTASALRQYRYQHQGALWTRGSRGRCVGRFCCCTLMTVVFLIISIVLALALWLRPPGIVIGGVAPAARDGSQITTQQNDDGVSLTIHLALNISVTNPNYFSVNFKQIKAELFYPINNTPIGGGTSNNIVFPSNSQTDWTFPFDVQYKAASDPQGRILADLVAKCGPNGSDLDVKYKITLGLRIIVFTISPVIANTFTFPCPVDQDTLGKIGGALGGTIGI